MTHDLVEAACCWLAVYNQDNREKVARDEAKYEAEQKVLRDKNRRAESDFRHAALLARVRAQPLVRRWRPCTPASPRFQPAWYVESYNMQVECTMQEAAVQSGVDTEPAGIQPPVEPVAPTNDAACLPVPPVKHDIMASKRAVQSPDGHFNFWRAEELRADNAEAKVGECSDQETSRGQALRSYSSHNATHLITRAHSCR